MPLRTAKVPATRIRIPDGAGGISRKGEINDQGNGCGPESAQAGMPKIF